MTNLKRDGDGYLLDPSTWSIDVMDQMLEEDGLEITEDQYDQIMEARKFFEEYGTVPPIRKFAKLIGRDRKVMFKQWMTGPMKPISKYGGLPKPTGCV